MNRNTNTKALVESGLMTALTVVLMLASYYLPLLGFTAMFVWPLPIAMVYVRHGKKYSLMALAASGLVAGLILGDFIPAAAMVLTFGIASVLLGYCVVHKTPVYYTIVLMGVAIFVGVLVMFKVYSVFLNQDLTAIFVDAFNQSIEAVKKMYASMNVSEEIVNQVLSAFDANKLVMVMPFVLAGSSLLMAFICYFMAGKVFKRFSIQVESVKPFSEWYLPKKLVFAVTIFVLIAYLTNYTKWNMGQSFFANTYLVFMYMFMINGLCSVDYFLKSKRLPRVIRVIVCVLIVFSGISTMLLFTGLIENALNLRKLDKSRIRRV